MPLLSRKRVNFDLFFEGATPSEKDIVENVASVLKAKQELISVRHIYTKYGESKAKVIIHLYNTIEELKNIEEFKKKKKKGNKKEGEQATPQQQPKQEVKEEKKEVKESPKEEKKEVPKEQSKKEIKEQPKEVKEEKKEEVKKDAKEEKKE
jgi:ribosomal protein S24E